MRYEFTDVRERSILRVFLFMSIVLLAFVYQKPVFLVAGSVLCAIYALVTHTPLRMSQQQLIVFFGVCVLFIPAFINLQHGLSPIFYFFSTISVFFSAKAITRYPPSVLLSAFRLIYGGAIVGIVIVLYMYWGYPEPFGMVIEGSSTNGIPAYLIVIQIGLSLCTYLVYRRLPVISPICTGVVAIFGNGRGSLVVAGLIILATLLVNLILIRSFPPRRRVVFVFALIILIICISPKIGYMFDQLIDHTKLSAGLADGNRIEILDQYLEKINPWTLFVGGDYAHTVIEYEYDGNPHISYVRTHAFFGLFVTVVALLSPLIPIFSRKTWSAKLVFVSFIGLAAMRAASEPIFFPTLLDFFYFLYFFIFFRYAPNGLSAEMRSSQNGGHA